MLESILCSEVSIMSSEGLWLRNIVVVMGVWSVVSVSVSLVWELVESSLKISEVSVCDSVFDVCRVVVNVCGCLRFLVMKIGRKGLNGVWMMEWSSLELR